MGELASRKTQTDERIKTLRQKLDAAEEIARDKACVYATGSFGRREASLHSDLDLFIVGKAGKEGRSQLKRLDEILVKAELIKVTRDLGIPEFSGDGRYLIHYSVGDLTKTLGKPEDDALNTFTARLLLLLESFPLLESSVYKEIIADVVASYWRDYEDHKDNFVPAFLSNDVLRLWRTFCVNYEANTANEPEEANAKRRLKNFKLKHSRLLTCYSALLFFLAIYQQADTVTPDDALAMIQLTPTERLEWILVQKEAEVAHHAIKTLLEKYEQFLETTNAEEGALIKSFLDKKTAHEQMNRAYAFGDTVFDALNALGQGNRYHRLLVV